MEAAADAARSVSLQACADVVARGDPPRFRAAMAAPVAARRVLFPLYAFNVEIARAPWVTAEPMIGEMRLQWWRDALEEIAQGGPVRRHEVVTPLAKVLDHPGAALLDAAVEARRWDLHRDPFEDEADFQAHIDATSGHLMWTAARLLGAPGQAEGAVRDVGFAAGLAAWFCAVPVLESRGCLPLPDGRAEAVAALARQGLARLNGALGQIPAGARPALLPAATARSLLRKAAKAPVHVAQGTLAGSEAAARLALIRTRLTGRL